MGESGKTIVWGFEEVRDSFYTGREIVVVM